MRSQRRSGFTLLEIMLATAIGVLLLGALYVAFNTQLRHVDAGRDAVEESVLARAILTRIANDVSASLPPISPPPRSSSGQGSSSSASATPSTSPATGTSTSTPVAGPAVQFNLGLQGDGTSMVLFVSRVPRELTGSAAGSSPPLVSDLRRVTYWLAGGAGSPRGLARQELKLATADEALGEMGTDMLDETAFIIAEEVRSLEFRYFDGTGWVDTWDGAISAGTSGGTTGPPLAVEIKIGVAPSTGTRRQPEGLNPIEPTIKYYRHVVAIATANGPGTGQ